MPACLLGGDNAFSLAISLAARSYPVYATVCSTSSSPVSTFSAACSFLRRHGHAPFDRPRRHPCRALWCYIGDAVNCGIGHHRGSILHLLLLHPSPAMNHADKTREPSLKNNKKNHRANFSHQEFAAMHTALKPANFVECVASIGDARVQWKIFGCTWRHCSRDHGAESHVHISCQRVRRYHTPSLCSRAHRSEGYVERSATLDDI